MLYNLLSSENSEFLKKQNNKTSVFRGFLSKIKNKLNEKNGTALMLAILILAFLTIMSACFSLIVPASYQIDETTRKMEQGTIYAKAGLNIAVDEIKDRASTGGTDYIRSLGNSGKTIKGSFSDLVYKDSAGNAITADEAKCPELDSFNDLDLTISFKIFNSGSGTSNEVFKVISTVNYEGIEASAFRYLYFSSSAAGTETNPFNEDAIACAEKVHVRTSVDGRIRARYVDINGGGTYRDVYAIESLETGSNTVIIQRDDSGIEGTEGNVYSLNNISFGSLIMQRAGDTSDKLEQVGGTAAAGGYIAVTGYGNAHPEALIAHGNDKYSYNSKEYAIYLGNSKIYYIGDADILTDGKCKSESDVPVAIYSNGNCGICFNYGPIIIYGNVYINGDWDLTRKSNITIYGNLYVAGEINQTQGDAINVLSWTSTDESGNTITLGGDMQTGLSSDQFSALTASSTWLSEQDIKNEVGDRNLKNAILPTEATSNRIKIQNFIGGESADGDYSLNNDEGKTVYSTGNEWYHGVTYGVLRVTESCEIVGDMNSLIGSGGQSSLTDSNGNQLPIYSGEMVLFLDASGLADGENLDVVISGEWKLGDDNTGYASRRIYVCDKDGKCNVRLFLKGGDNGNAAHLYIYNPQVYVPVSSVGNVTAENICNKSIPSISIPSIDITLQNWTDSNGRVVPRFFVFGQGKVDSSENIVTDDDIMTSIDISGSETFDGFILTPISSVVINPSNANPNVVYGKVSAGIFTSDTPSGKVLTYVRPTSEDERTSAYYYSYDAGDFEDSATLGVFETDSGAFVT